MNKWIELADRWTPKCPKCKEPLDCRTTQFGAATCDNPECPANPDREEEKPCQPRK